MRLSLFVLFLFMAHTCLAQRQNVYFLKNNGTYVSLRDSADYIRVVREPDSASNLYNVFEFYLNGTKKMMGKSSKIDPPKLEGSCIRYYKNGHKEELASYKGGVEVGSEYDFFPNGKPYRVKVYPENGTIYYNLSDNFQITANYDSLGNVLVDNGEGYYKGYSNDFTYINEEGPIKAGRRNGAWKGDFKNTKTTFTENYQDGALITGTATFWDGTTSAYTKSRQEVPQFRGGVAGFGRFLSNNIVYPDYARSHNIQGIVLLSFVVEKDGKLTDIKVMESVNPVLDDEAVRVLKDSPRWTPGTMFGKPVRVFYSVPVNFALTN